VGRAHEADRHQHVSAGHGCGVRVRRIDGAVRVRAPDQHDGRALRERGTFPNCFPSSIRRCASRRLIEGKHSLARSTTAVICYSLLSLIPSSIHGLKQPRLAYNFTTSVFLNALLQYNTDSGQLSSNLRLNIIHRPLSDFFLVYNERRDEQTNVPLDRALIVKLTYMVAM
jgi:hypothetical protein